MKHLKKFLSAATYQEYIMEGGYDVPNVSYIKKTGDVYFISNIFKDMYLTTEATTNGTITFTIGKSVSTDSLPFVAYSVDNGETWVTTQNANNTQQTVTVNVSKGDKVLWKGMGTRTGTYATNTGTNYISYFGGTAFFETYGNAMSLLNGDNFQGVMAVNDFYFKRLFYNSNCVNAKHLILPATTLTRYCYYCMFEGCKNLVNAPALPSMALASYCYSYMFNGCTNLVSAPALPATTLADNCYYYMFYKCTSLINAPALPSTALTNYCYSHMFDGCKNLVKAPALPATTLANFCYYYMFYNCTSLINAPALPVTTLASYCYSYMFYGCTSLVNAPALPATALASYCYSAMFEGCTSLVNAPALPSTALASYCYSYMFYGCTNLVSAPVLPATTLVPSCYYYMFYKCTSLVNAPALPATTLVPSCYSFMFDGCTSLVNAPALPATTLAGNCYYCMFYNCTSLINAPALPATTLVADCYREMFRVCTSLVNAPALPATTLAANCYKEMFEGCTSLINAPALPATTLVTDCYREMFYGCENLQRIECMATNAKSDFTERWVYGVAETGVFVGNASSTWVSGENGVPNGWSTNVTIIQTPESNQTLGIYIDDFPEDIYEWYGYDTMYEWFYDEYGGDGNDYFELCGDQIEYNGVAYYAWIFWGDSPTPFKYILTQTNDYTELRNMSIDYDFDNIYNSSPIKGYLYEDLTTYSFHDRGDLILEVIQI